MRKPPWDAITTWTKKAEPVCVSAAVPSAGAPSLRDGVNGGLLPVPDLPLHGTGIDAARQILDEIDMDGQITERAEAQQ